MNPQIPRTSSDEMRPEYDLSEGVRGKHHEAYRAGTNVVFLDPDIAEVFTDSAAVKQVLRQLVKLARTHVSMKSRRRSEEFVSAFAAETRALAALNMDIDLRRRMLDYYNERAPEYEEAYTLGTGTASIPDPEVFRTEATSLSGIVRTFAHGHLIDLACGTAYWLPHYADSCVQITLFDQSEKMLEEGRTKVADLGIADRCIVLQGDFFEYEFGRQAYDCALVGFFLSHLTEAQESLLFGALRHMLQSSGRFLILDSAWSTERARFNAKVERQQRRLNDGTEFEIYKRYCDRADISEWAAKYDATVHVEHFGTAFYAVSGRFNVHPEQPAR